MKILAIFLIITLVVAESGKCGDSCTWEFTNDTFTLGGSGLMTNFSYGGEPWKTHRTSIKML